MEDTTLGLISKTRQSHARLNVPALVQVAALAIIMIRCLDLLTVLPLAKIGKLLNRPEYVEEAVYQFLLHVQNLMDRETGLWFHGWNYDGQHNFANARWARGNSWLTIVIPDFLELVDLPKHNAVRRYLVQVLNAQIAALAKCQDESGLWHTLLDDPDSYLEASATAGFGYGILKAVRKGYVGAEYADVADDGLAQRPRSPSTAPAAW
jgi:unsaturated rhamnogalacturonyl hydrolase